MNVRKRRDFLGYLTVFVCLLTFPTCHPFLYNIAMAPVGFAHLSLNASLTFRDESVSYAKLTLPSFSESKFSLFQRNVSMEL
jgi:hypothetical protein